MMIPVMLAAMTLGGCSHKENADIPAVVTVEHTAVRIDSLRMESHAGRFGMDPRFHICARQRDTVRMEVWHWRTRDRVRNDAEVRRCVDTVVREIPVAVERRVEVPVERVVEKERPLPRWKRALMALRDFIADLSALQNLGAVSMGVTQDIDSCGETVGVRTQTAAR